MRTGSHFPAPRLTLVVSTTVSLPLICSTNTYQKGAASPFERRLNTLKKSLEVMGLGKLNLRKLVGAWSGLTWAKELQFIAPKARCMGGKSCILVAIFCLLGDHSALLLSTQTTLYPPGREPFLSSDFGSGVTDELRFGYLQHSDPHLLHA